MGPSVVSHSSSNGSHTEAAAGSSSSSSSTSCGRQQEPHQQVGTEQETGSMQGISSDMFQQYNHTGYVLNMQQCRQLMGHLQMAAEAFAINSGPESTSISLC